MKRIKNPGRGGGRKPGKTIRLEVFMSLLNIITKCRESKAYFRGLVIRAIEDACILFLIGVAVWAVCALSGAVLNSMGVL